MRAQAKGIEWDESKARVKAQRKAYKSPQNTTITCPSIHRYHLKQIIAPISTAKQQTRTARLRLAHSEFISGSAIDRKHLQQQANTTHSTHSKTKNQKIKKTNKTENKK